MSASAADRAAAARILAAIPPPPEPDPGPCAECGQRLTVDGDAEWDPWREPWHVFCDVCGGAEHPADLTPDWNPAIGRHRSCYR